MEAETLEADMEPMAIKSRWLLDDDDEEILPTANGQVRLLGHLPNAMPEQNNTSSKFAISDSGYVPCTSNLVS